MYSVSENKVLRDHYILLQSVLLDMHLQDFFFFKRMYFVSNDEKFPGIMNIYDFFK